MNREIVHHTRDGIPYLAPELVLLFKAKHPRQKDQADFDSYGPLMTLAQRDKMSRPSYSPGRTPDIAGSQICNP